MRSLPLRLAALALAALALPARAELPVASGPLTIVVPAAAGDDSDTLARIVAPGLAKAWGQPVNVENVPEDGGIAAAWRVARSTWGSYTYLLAPDATIDDPRKHYFAPVVLVATSPLVVVTAPKARIAGMADLARRARAKPGSIAYGAVGDRRANGLAGELFKSVAGVDLRRVAYATAQEALEGVRTGKVQVAFVPMRDARAPVAAGRVKAIAVTGAERAGALPAVPTVAESGFAGYEAVNWHGLMLPIAIPRPLHVAQNAEADKVLAAPEVREKIRAAGFEPGGGSVNRLDALIRMDREQWLKLAVPAATRP